MKGSSLAVALDAGRMSHARSESRPDDRFERLYVQALPEEPPEDAREQEREASEGHARAKPDEPFALGGCVVTPERALDPGWVVVGGGAIAALRDTAPRDVRTIETRGVILPGLVDLHGHPSTTSFPRGSRRGSTRTATAGARPRNTRSSSRGRGTGSRTRAADGHRSFRR